MDTQRIEELVDLKGKAAVVTGGGTGIGQAIAIALAQAGAAVMIAESNLDAAYETIGEIRERGGYAEAMVADAGNPDDARRVMEETVVRFGALDILVNSAATFSFSAALSKIEGLWSKTLSSHVKGVYYSCTAAAQCMMQLGRGGRIINIASLDAMEPTSALPAGNGQNSVAQLTKALSVEYDPYKITVNALAPGVVRKLDTQMQGVSITGPSASSPEITGGQPLADSPLERVGSLDELATVVLFLVSDAGEQITGNLVTVG